MPTSVTASNGANAQKTAGVTVVHPTPAAAAPTTTAAPAPRRKSYGAYGCAIGLMIQADGKKRDRERTQANGGK